MDVYCKPLQNSGLQALTNRYHPENVGPMPSRLGICYRESVKTVKAGWCSTTAKLDRIPDGNVRECDCAKPEASKFPWLSVIASF